MLNLIAIQNILHANNLSVSDRITFNQNVFEQNIHAHLSLKQSEPNKCVAIQTMRQPVSIVSIKETCCQ